MSPPSSGANPNSAMDCPIVAGRVPSGQLGSVKLITAADGTQVKRSTYAPYGEATDEMLSLTKAEETKGFITLQFEKL